MNPDRVKEVFRAIELFTSREPFIDFDLHPTVSVILKAAEDWAREHAMDGQQL